MREVVYFDDYSLRECPYSTRESVGGDSYGCSHRQNAARERVGRRMLGYCATFNCPLGAELVPSNDADDAKILIAHGHDPALCSDSAWFILERPKRRRRPTGDRE